MSLEKGMHGTCETVRVKTPVSTDNPAGEIVINKADFDPEQHELVGAKAEAGKGEKTEKGKGKKNETKDEAEAGKGEK